MNNKCFASKVDILGMKKEEADIKEILLRENYISEADLARAKKFETESHGNFLDFLFSEGLVNRDILGQAMAEHFDVPYANLGSYLPTRDQVLKLPESVAKKYNAVVFKEDDDGIVVATDNPKEAKLTAEIKKIFPGKKVFLNFSLTEDIESAFMHYQKTLSTRFSDIIQTQKKFAPAIVETIIADAVNFRASDIHFEPQGPEVVIRFRIDGILQEAGRIAKDYYDNVLNRIKVQAQLRIDEHSSAQDGAVRFPLPNKTMVDLRVSIVPAVDGEKIVIRLLSQYVRSFTLPEIGLGSADQAQILDSVKKPFGMILVTGPTGAGKTTTLYTLLKILNKPQVNITTIEDPVEYKILGTNQIQVNNVTNLTFANGLRSIVRQDPNIILVGEIRDMETAEIAVNAALTGHLLLSTFHANDAATAIPRLLNMGIEPFLLASTLEIVVAQRLARKLCEICRYSVSATKINLKSYGPIVEQALSGKGVTLYSAKGCDACNHTGYRGRIAIFELIRITPALQDLILRNPSAKEIWEVASKEGGHNLFEDGLEKIKSGVTTLEEVIRVAPPRQF